MAHDVFISYSSANKPIADAVCATLEGKRVRCWIAPRDVIPGLSYAECITDGIVGSRVLVLVLSSSANGSHQVDREVEAAVSAGLPVLPFRVEDVQPSKRLTHFIKSVNWLDALTPPLERHLETLAATVDILLARGRPAGAAPTSPPSPPTNSTTAGWRRGRVFLAAALVAVGAAVGAAVVSGITRGWGDTTRPTDSTPSGREVTRPSRKDAGEEALPRPTRNSTPQPLPPQTPPPVAQVVRVQVILATGGYEDEHGALPAAGEGFKVGDTGVLVEKSATGNRWLVKWDRDGRASWVYSECLTELD